MVSEIYFHHFNADGTSPSKDCNVTSPTPWSVETDVCQYEAQSQCVRILACSHRHYSRNSAVTKNLEYPGPLPPGCSCVVSVAVAL